MKDNADLPSESSLMILFYQTEDGKSRIEVKLEDGTVWLTQGMISELYQTTKQNVSLNINNILIDEELDNSTVKEYLTVQPDGKRVVQELKPKTKISKLLRNSLRARGGRFSPSHKQRRFPVSPVQHRQHRS